MYARMYRMPILTTPSKILEFRALDLHSLKIKAVAALTLDFDSSGGLATGTPYEAGESFTMSHLDFIRSELVDSDKIEIWAIAAGATNADIAIIRR